MAVLNWYSSKIRGDNCKAAKVPSLPKPTFKPNARARSFPLNHLTRILLTTTILVSAPSP